MGTGDEFPSESPRRSKVVEKLIEEGEFGLNGAGLVAVAAGGFFSLVVDEIGQVRSISVTDAQTKFQSLYVTPAAYFHAHPRRGVNVVVSVRMGSWTCGTIPASPLSIQRVTALYSKQITGVLEVLTSRERTNVLLDLERRESGSAVRDF